MGEERDGNGMGGWLPCTDLPLSIRSLVITTHHKKMLTGPCERGQTHKQEKRASILHQGNVFFS